jgi:hypothetical protein
MTSNQDTVELTVRLELGDFLRANYWHLLRNLGVRVLIVLAVFSLAAPIYLLVRDPEAVSVSMIATLLLLPGLLLLMFAGVYFGARASFASNKSLQEAITYRFSPQGIDAIAASSSGHTDWTNLYQAHETNHSFLVFIARNLMYTIPKRCFNDSQQMTAFRSLLKSRLTERAKLKFA